MGESGLAQKKCVPCEGGVQPLSESHVQELLPQVPEWVLEESKLKREFKFKNFVQAMEFVNKVAEIAEGEGHHPDISIHYNRVSLELYTHAINGLHENDFILAAKVNEIQ